MAILSKTWWRLGLILIAVLLAGLIALQTRKHVHPDEYIHLDAFYYYQDHWWPPQWGSDEVIYSDAGRSRVYNGEIVYIFYGKLGKIFQLVGQPAKEQYLIYRLLNIGLFFLTLAALFFVRCQWFNPTLIGLVFIVIPQVHYIYAYANSDAWGLSMGVFLFLVVATGMDKPLKLWSWLRFILLGGLTGLIFLAKVPFLLGLLLPYALIITKVIQESRQSETGLVQWLSQRLLVLGVVVVVVAAPLKIIYPLTQGELSVATFSQVMNARDINDDLQSDSFNSNSLISGKTLLDVMVEPLWFEFSLKSFYGVFGHFRVWNPTWIYWIMSLFVIAGLCLTGWVVANHWRKLNWNLQVCLALSPCIIIINVAVSIYHSLYVHFQPQGRYLFPSLIPISFLLGGFVFAEKEQFKSMPKFMWVIPYIICLYSLIFVAATSFITSKSKEHLYLKNPFQTIQPLYHNFASHVALLGVDPKLKDNSLEVQLYWYLGIGTYTNANRPTVYVHLVDNQAQRLSGSDVLFEPNSLRAFSYSIFISDYELILPSHIAPGTYNLVIGMYYFDNDQQINLSSTTLKEAITIKK